MFNLGYKHVVLNNLDGIGPSPEDPSFLRISVFGDLKKRDIKTASQLAPADPIAEVAKFTPVTPITSGTETADVKIVLKKIDTDARETIHFSAASADKADVIKGFNEWEKLHGKAKIALSGGFTTTIQPGFEGWIVSSFILRTEKVGNVSESGVVHKFTKTVTKAGSAGIGRGWQLEASVHMGTFVNANPYGQQHGGNSHTVDLTAGYKAYYMSADVPVENGWESPDFVKHAYVNADTTSTAVKFTVYVHEDYISDFEAMLA